MPGTKDGYQHLTGGKAWEVAGPSRWEFVVGKQKLPVWLDSPPNEQVIFCAGIGYTV